MNLRNILRLCAIGCALTACKSNHDLHNSNMPVYEAAQWQHFNKLTRANTGSIQKQGDLYLPQSESVQGYEAFESCTDYTDKTTSISQICSKTIYSDKGKFAINTPKKAKDGDLLLLFLSRTDNPLPHSINGWDLAASCLKSNNSQQHCQQVQDCETLQDNYCVDTDNSGSKKGEDLATVVFYKTFDENDTQFNFDLKGSKPAWAVLVSVRGANNTDPIGSIATEASDDSKDSVFPSVDANAGDLLLLSMAFDDTADINAFAAPHGFQTIAWVAGNDEAGSIYAQIRETSGESGTLKTRGKGASKNKDALISIVINAH